MQLALAVLNEASEATDWSALGSSEDLTALKNQKLGFMMKNIEINEK